MSLISERLESVKLGVTPAGIHVLIEVEDYEWLIRMVEAGCPAQPCEMCDKFFSVSKFGCNKPNECDCPKCQGLCDCDVGIADMV